MATSGKDFVKFQDGQVSIAACHKCLTVAFVQGMKKLFYNCEEHMFRVGDRNIPFGLQWVGGSDWVVLHKTFIHYLVYSDDAMVSVQGKKTKYAKE